MGKLSWVMILCVAACFMMAKPALAKDDRVSFSNDITVDEGTSSGDLVCVLCSIRVHGDVHGDVVTLLGSVEIDDARSISGDVATVGGSVSLGDAASVNGDVTVLAGHLSKGPEAVVHGDSTVGQGDGWLLVPFAPLLILIGVIWLIVWLVTRRRYTLPTYPQGRRF